MKDSISNGLISLHSSAGTANTSFLIVEATEKQTSLPSQEVKKTVIVGFVEVASTREHCFVLAADVPFREYRAKVTSLVVDSAHRRKGIATLLLAACAKQSRLWSDHSELFLEVRNDNEGARQFYDRMGFRECFGWLIISCYLTYDYVFQMIAMFMRLLINPFFLFASRREKFGGQE